MTKLNTMTDEETQELKNTLVDGILRVFSDRKVSRSEGVQTMVMTYTHVLLSLLFEGELTDDAMEVAREFVNSTCSESMALMVMAAQEQKQQKQRELDANDCCPDSDCCN